MNDTHLHKLLTSSKKVTTSLPAHKADLRDALLAQHERRQASTHFFLGAFSQGVLAMKLTNVLKRVPIGAMAFAVVATGSVGAYAAANNWFGATATNAQQHGNVMSVDLSGCDVDMPGVQKDQTGTAKFQITAQQHIAPADLQKSLLAGCEFYSVEDFYMHSSEYSNLADAHMEPATITAVNTDGTLTVAYRVLGSDSTQQVRLALDDNATFYSANSPISRSSLAVGDHVVLWTQLAGTYEENLQKYGPMDQLNAGSTIVSVYKTTTDTKNGINQKDFYPQNGVEPLGFQERPAQH